MKVREILSYPDPRLRIPAEPVEVFDAALKQLTDDMLQTMYAADGIGLAAPQIHVSRRVVVVDLGEGEPRPEVLINPFYRVLDESQRHSTIEGCLSVPGLRVEVQRYCDIELHYCDLDGRAQVETPQGLRALCVQHEIDHLDGRLLVDYLSKMQRDRYKKYLLKRPGSEADDMHLEAAQAPCIGADSHGASAMKPISQI